MCMCGTMDAQFEVQRTIKRAELVAFLCLPKRILGLPRCMLITKELLMGL